MDENKKLGIDDLEDVSGGMIKINDMGIRRVKPGSRVYTIVNGVAEAWLPTSEMEINIKKCEIRVVNNRRYYGIRNNLFVRDIDTYDPATELFL